MTCCKCSCHVELSKLSKEDQDVDDLLDSSLYSIHKYRECWFWQKEKRKKCIENMLFSLREIDGYLDKHPLGSSINSGNYYMLVDASNDMRRLLKLKKRDK